MFNMFLTEFENISPLMIAVVEAQILDINGEYSRNRPIEQIKEVLVKDGIRQQQGNKVSSLSLSKNVILWVQEVVQEVVDLALIKAQSDPTVMKGFNSFVS